MISDNACILDIVSKLEPFSFIRTGDDIKGTVYEVFLKATLRGEFDQYFTPRELVDFMVQFADPDIGDVILEQYLTTCADTMTIDDFYLDHLMATNEKLDFVRKNDSGTIQYYVPPQAGKLLSDNWMDILLSGSYAGFDTEKNVKLIERIVQWVTKGDDIVLDSFAGSGTTAHAILNVNKIDGDNRKFILIEMMDYASSMTAGRVKRVIDGYGTGKKAVEGTGGDFNYYELGAMLLMSDGNLNEEVGEQKIREYVYYMETKEPLTTEQPANEPYFMGLCRNTAYYFYYEREIVTTLDYAFLATIQIKAEGYTIYADLCTIPQNTLRRHNITFKKIPRDIARL